MYRVPPDRAWWPAVGARLERGVRRQRANSGADEFVVFAMSTDPEPMNALLARQANSSVVQTYPDAMHLAPTEQLEL